MNTIEPYEDENAFTYQQSNCGLEEYYPEIYKIVYPIVCKKCLYLNEEITQEWIERTTNEIYEIIESDEQPEETREIHSQVTYSHPVRHYRNIRNNVRVNEQVYEKEEKRQRNFLLNDLIKILLLRELIGPGNRPPRPRPGNVFSPRPLT